MSPAIPQTEVQLAEAQGIDMWDDEKILAVLIAGQERAIQAVAGASPAIATAATAMAERLRSGGRLYYAGAGSSIRIGVQDGSELHATFGMREEDVRYLIAGGKAALTETLATAEDDAEAGRGAALACQASDVLIAIAASGTTPYTVAAAKQARSNGALVVSVVNNSATPLGSAGDIEIVLNSGPEVISGSTRLGAGTAQKAALNLLSTLAHIKLGAIHDGLMVNVQADNAKLRARACGIVKRITGTSDEKAMSALAASGGHVKQAVLLCSGISSLAEAQELLRSSNGNLRFALSKARQTY